MKKGESTRLQIIDSASKIFYEKGFHSTTFAMVAKSARLTQPAIYSYFTDKEDLLSACCLNSAQNGRQQIESNLDPNLDASQTLKKYVEMNLNWVMTKPAEAYSLLAMYYIGHSMKAVKQLHKSIDDVGISRIETFLIRGNREQSWNIKTPLEVSKHIHSLLVGEMIKAFHWPGEVTPSIRHQRLWRFLVHILIRE
jgi:AcrR family transcriptional regulator